ncbi:MAG: 5'/3'-nucleotidase SurE [Erysipelotrichaceae bacterium]|nr:5'/3'-nucleotidase SurE [Erysipelotrichaceae bacterium]
MLYNKKILITNDDGFDADGIRILVEEIYKFTKDIIVIAPKYNSSAVSHSITLKDGLKLVKEESIFKNVLTYSLTGSPADCISVGIVYLKLNPDYVISGINNGLNMGIDILYSGTVAACFEAGIHNTKAIAFSSERNEFISASQIPNIIKYIESNEKLKNSPILNVNMPINAEGYKITKQGGNQFSHKYDLIDGLLFATGECLYGKGEKDIESDIRAYYDGYISITPLTIDRTKY